MLRLRTLFYMVPLVLLLGCTNSNKGVTILFTGDLLLDRGVRKQIEMHGVESLFTNISPLLKSADFTVANLECPATTIQAPINKRFVFCARPVWLTDVHNAGITHLVMANNHSNDQGRAGITDTYNNILAAGMQPVGYGVNQTQAGQPVVLSKNGVKVALFSSVTLPLENFAWLPDSPGVNQMPPDTMAAHIALYKKQNPGVFVVAVLHWGIEYRFKAEPYQYKQARSLIDAGADAVIGHHPHVVQQYMLYKGKPVFFSLGNFIFDQQAPADTGLVAGLHFDNNGVTVKQYPVVIKNCTPALQ